MSISKKFKIIGNRGVAGIEPENTLLGIKKALDLGLEMVEIDTRLSKDDEVILIHDSLVNRTTDREGLVKNKTLGELKKYDAGKGQKIPTLAEAWDLIKNKAEVNINIQSQQAMERILLFIEKEDIKEHVLLSSKYYWILEKAKRANPTLRTALVAYLPIGIIYQAKKIKAESIHPINLITTKRLVKKAHENNFKVYPFPLITRNENNTNIRDLLKIGVDGLFLNDPTKVNQI